MFRELARHSKLAANSNPCFHHSVSDVVLQVNTLITSDSLVLRSCSSLSERIGQAALPLLQPDLSAVPIEQTDAGTATAMMYLPGQLRLTICCQGTLLAVLF